MFMMCVIMIAMSLLTIERDQIKSKGKVTGGEDVYVCVQ